MRKIFFCIVLFLTGFSIGNVSCSNSDDELITPNPPVMDPDIPPPSYPTFDYPNWSVLNCNRFEHSMTISVVLPDSLINEEQPADKLAVFVGDDCRGVADRIEISTDKHIWMAMVYGNNTSEVFYFKYYSNKTKYMYQSNKTMLFIVDGTIGTIDSPQTIGMSIVTNK